jgi:hypothetical protein
MVPPKPFSIREWRREKKKRDSNIIRIPDDPKE